MNSAHERSHIPIMAGYLAFHCPAKSAKAARAAAALTAVDRCRCEGSGDP